MPSTTRFDVPYLRRHQSPAWAWAWFVLPVFLGLALSFGGSADAQPFRGDIDRWVAQDAIDPPPPGAILFTGSSSIRRYEQLAQDFADYTILQRGFGGAQFEHVNRYVHDIVLPYRPRAIVLWVGTNDLADGETGAEVFADYQAFVGLVHAAQPEVDIFYLGIMPTPGRLQNGPQEAIANASIESFAADHPRLHYVDLPAAFQALDPPDGEAFTSKFVDAIHLNRAGYELWTEVIRPQIQAVVAPHRKLADNPASPRPGTSLFFDFGPSNPEDGDPAPSPDPRGNHWNHWHPAEGKAAINAGERITRLVDHTGAATGIDLTITGGFQSNGKRHGGLLDPQASRLGDLAVAEATQDYFFSTADGEQGGGNDDVPGGFMLKGLDPALAYEFRFFGSRHAEATRVTEYRMIGRASQSILHTTSGANISADGSDHGNDDAVAVVTGVRPDAFGQVFVDLTLKEGGYAYLNAMQVTVLPGP